MLFYNLKQALWTLSKMYFIVESITILILRLRVSFKHIFYICHLILFFEKKLLTALTYGAFEII